MKDLLTRLLEYMEAREDADGDSEGIYPNQEMQFAIEIRDVLREDGEYWDELFEDLNGYTFDFIKRKYSLIKNNEHGYSSNYNSET